MRQNSWKLVLLSLLIGCVVAGCTLIAEVDRGEIGTGGAGGAAN